MLLSFIKGFSVSAQDKTIVPATGNFQGIVIDNDTRERLAIVVIHNLNNHRIWYNTLKGEFKVDAQIGDKLVFTKEDYHPDTLVVGSMANIIVFMWIVRNYSILLMRERYILNNILKNLIT